MEYRRLFSEARYRQVRVRIDRLRRLPPFTVILDSFELARGLGLLDEEFWNRVREERPHRVDEINEFLATHRDLLVSVTRVELLFD